jgi:predicted MFS family arabinose efflux permease
MVLPVEGVRAENRAVGMGVYFTCYYVGMTIALPFAGLARDMTGDPAAPLWLAGAALLIALASLVVFRVIQRSGDSQWIR